MKDLQCQFRTEEPNPSCDLAHCLRPSLYGKVGRTSGWPFRWLVLGGIGCLLIAREVAARNVAAWGSDYYGVAEVPAGVVNPRGIAAGAFHCLAVNGDGSVVGWGKNRDGQASVPAAATNVVAVAAGGDHSLALRADGSVVGWGRNWDGQASVPAAATNVVAIAAGWAHSLALRADGTVVAWGNNDYGQASASCPAVDVIAIAAGYYHNMALRSDGGVVTWGWDYAVPEAATREVVAVAAGWEHCLALRADGTVVAWGDNTFGQGSVPEGVTNVVAIAAGYYHNLAVRADGTVVAWGRNYYGVTEVPAAVGNVTVVAAGEDYSLALVRLGPPQFAYQPVSTLAVAGDRVVLSGGVLGSLPVQYQWYRDSVPLTDCTNRFLVLTELSPAEAGRYTLLASNSLGVVTSRPVTVTVSSAYPARTRIVWWGSSGSGQCATPVNVCEPRAISAGAFHCLALNADGTVAGWGKNRDGQADPPGGLTNAIAIAAGGDHSLALKEDGSVVAWGRNWDHQTDVPETATNVVGIAAGFAHSVALRSDGTVLAWGNNEYGQTNVPLFGMKVLAIASGYYHNLALLEDRTVVSWGLPYPVPSSATNVVALDAGWGHSLALRADGSVVAWGENGYGQCEVPPDATNIVAVSAGYYHSLALRDDGTAVAWGAPHFSVTNVPTGLESIAAVAAGEDYNLVLTASGPPWFLTFPRPAVATANASVVFHTDLAGASPLSFQWYHDGNAIPGATGRFLVLDHVESSRAGLYSLAVVDGRGRTNSRSTTLEVRLAPQLAVGLSEQRVPTHACFCLSGKVFGLEPISYQWRFNGTTLTDTGRLSGTATKTLCVSASEAADSGLYELVVWNAAGAATGLVAKVMVSEIVGWGDNSSGQIDIPAEATNILAISSGGFHNLALRGDHTVISWGDNTYGQNQVPAEASNVVAIADGGTHCLALRSDGSVIGWGDNRVGEAKVPDHVSNVVAIAAGEWQSLALRSDGSVVTWGIRGQTPAALTNAAAIAAGDFFGLALDPQGRLYQWGFRPLPVPPTNVLKIAASGDRGLALCEDGTLLSGGLRIEGGLLGWGLWSTNAPARLTNAVAIAAGFAHGLALQADGRIVAWGDNWFGQSTVPPFATNAVAISAGANHSLMLAAGRPTTEAFALPRSVRLGERLVLIAGFPGGPGVTYQWQLNGLDIPGATKAALAVEAAHWTNSGTYRVVISNAYETVVGQPTVVSIARTPLQFDVSSCGIQPPGNHYHLRLLGASGAGPILIESTTNLTHWQVAFENPPAMGPLDFDDPGSPESPQKFYRAIELPQEGVVRLEPGATPPFPTGTLPIRVTGLSARGEVVIHASSDLVHWQPVFTNPPTIGPLWFRESLPDSPTRRFYRVSESR